ncbi:FAD-dependent oxidoreductase [Paenarthrobacter sp. PH39-S1]|uniref:NAD(P)/FAD-dependent oxidoreductase n=1 Tax=Paenarthrobacter sp. PH39-S1 TaxID=3046204 RepID=UPI0024B8F7FB|nr:FAD-dependent oxidoreductase [Paenarthrobacter sp. PH39-S1]MDJ0357753.1 FAD-dependent oxidoreductase [Paenarthrobacter sp. PH39-S1]
MNTDVLIVGGGIAGLSLACKLAPHAAVVLVEAEGTLAYHTSSRSARQMQPSYGPAAIRELTARSIEAVRGISAELGQPILQPRPLIFIGTEADVTASTAANAHLRPLGHAETLLLSPDLRPDAFAAACLDDSAMEVDVPALLEYYRSGAVAAGAAIMTGLPVHTMQRTSGGWIAGAGEEAIVAAVVVNAAGAWADPLAVIAGVGIQCLRPHRRTAAIVRTEQPVNPAGPMVAAVDNSFYYRPDGSALLISPCESIPSIAEDARAVEGDVRRLIERLNAVTSLGIAGLERSWTGLRTSGSDGLPVVGFDAESPGFFWLAGQGGYGIQTSAAIAELAAGLILSPAEPPNSLSLELAADRP